MHNRSQNMLSILKLWTQGSPNAVHKVIILWLIRYQPQICSVVVELAAVKYTLWYSPFLNDDCAKKQKYTQMHF